MMSKILKIGFLFLLVLFSLSFVSAEENFSRLQTDVDATSDNGILNLNDNYT